MKSNIEQSRMETLQIALRNQAILAKELAPMWQMKQDIDFPVTTYMQSIPTKPAEIPLAADKSSNLLYEELSIKLAKQLGSSDNADYVLDRLTLPQMIQLNASFDESIKKIKASASGSITKSDFVFLLKNKVFGLINPKNDITTFGDYRQKEVVKQNAEQADLEEENLNEYQHNEWQRKQLINDERHAEIENDRQNKRDKLMEKGANKIKKDKILKGVISAAERQKLHDIEVNRVNLLFQRLESLETSMSTRITTKLTKSMNKAIQSYESGDNAEYEYRIQEITNEIDNIENKKDTGQLDIVPPVLPKGELNRKKTIIRSKLDNADAALIERIRQANIPIFLVNGNLSKDKKIIDKKLMNKGVPNEYFDLLFDICNEPVTGLGFRVFRGRGISTEHNKKVFDKYYIDLKKLNQNVISLKYVKNSNVVQTYKPTIISGKVKHIIENIMNNNFIQSEYNLLPQNDKRIIRNLNRYISFNLIGAEKDDDEFQTKFEILRGEIGAGNDSRIVRTEFRKFILTGIQEGKIARKEGIQLIQDLNL
jgi:hypothetical protein